MRTRPSDSLQTQRLDPVSHRRPRVLARASTSGQPRLEAEGVVGHEAALDLRGCTLVVDQVTGDITLDERWRAIFGNSH
jgi:hypothetical protein